MAGSSSFSSLVSFSCVDGRGKSARLVRRFFEGLSRTSSGESVCFRLTGSCGTLLSIFVESIHYSVAKKRIPWQNFDVWSVNPKDWDTSKRYVVFSKHGWTSAIFCSILLLQGLEVWDIAGGFDHSIQPFCKNLMSEKRDMAVSTFSSGVNRLQL